MSKSKRQELPVDSQHSGGLWMVATPIGNVADLSPRARETLAGVALAIPGDGFLHATL